MYIKKRQLCNDLLFINIMMIAVCRWSAQVVKAEQNSTFCDGVLIIILINKK